MWCLKCFVSDIQSENDFWKPDTLKSQSWVTAIDRRPHQRFSCTGIQGWQCHFLCHRYMSLGSLTIFCRTVLVAHLMQPILVLTAAAWDGNWPFSTTTTQWWQDKLRILHRSLHTYRHEGLSLFSYDIKITLTIKQCAKQDSKFTIYLLWVHWHIFSSVSTPTQMIVWHLPGQHVISLLTLKSGEHYTWTCFYLQRFQHISVAFTGR